MIFKIALCLKPLQSRLQESFSETRGKKLKSSSINWIAQPRKLDYLSEKDGDCSEGGNDGKVMNEKMESSANK